MCASILDPVLVPQKQHKDDSNSTNTGGTAEALMARSAEERSRYG